MKMLDEQSKTIINKTSGFKPQAENFKNCKWWYEAAIKVLYPTVASEIFVERTTEQLL